MDASEVGRPLLKMEEAARLKSLSKVAIESRAAVVSHYEATGAQQSLRSASARLQSSQPSILGRCMIDSNEA